MHWKISFPFNLGFITAFSWISSCNAQDQKTGEFFQEAHLQNIKKRIVRLIRRKNTSYKRRQAIVEHPFGTIKRQWGSSYILTKKGIKRAGADVGFMLISYNLRRIGNILTSDRLREYLRILVLLFLGKKDHPRLKKSPLKPSFFRVPVWAVKYEWALVPA